MDRPYKILIVDDEPDILEFLKFNFEQKGFHVLTTKNGQKAVKLAMHMLPDVILLDVMMPKMNGLETCRKMRKKKDLQDTLIIFLTARDDEETEIAGFEAGGDDFITKPIRIRTLVKRVESLINRRMKKSTQPGQIVLDDFRIDDNAKKIIIGDREYMLPRLQYLILKLLASEPERVFTREEIYERIWGDVVVSDRTLDVHIRNIRSKIGDEYIKTLKGVGYRFNKKS